MKRVLFITYRPTLARDIMRNFKKLGFNNYLDSYENPDVWNSPKLIVQLDSLMNAVLKNTKYKEDERFDPKYDLIVLDESESLLNHFDEEAMEGKDIHISISLTNCWSIVKRLRCWTGTSANDP